MKHACYWEGYGSTRADDLNKRVLMRRFARPVCKPEKKSLALAKRHKRWSRAQARRKIADESAHRGMPESVESKIKHFSHSLLRWKFFKGDPVESHKNAGAVIAVVAMNENF